MQKGEDSSHIITNLQDNDQEVEVGLAQPHEVRR